MGSVTSTCIIPPSDDNKSSPFGELPESVVASILTHLNPQDICRLAVVNKAFYAASSADFIWDVKLPHNYKTSDGHVCKKDVYANLCGLNSLDADTKKVSFDKSTGMPSVTISYNGLKITNFDDRRYWNRITTDESRFRSISYVQQTWWLEVAGEVEFPFPVGTYNVYYRLQLGRLVKRFGWRVGNQEHIHGWDVKPVKFQLSTSDGQEAMSQCYLTTPGEWILYHAGSFVVKDSKASIKEETLWIILRFLLYGRLPFACVPMARQLQHLQPWAAFTPRFIYTLRTQHRKKHHQRQGCSGAATAPSTLECSSKVAISPVWKVVRVVFLKERAQLSL
nr:hypothetical protein [Tanacetum cinerariifolium]